MNASTPTPTGKPPGAGRRRRRRGKPSGKPGGKPPQKPGADTPAHVIKTAAEPERDRDVEEPLRPEEVEDMKRHFKFLQNHRRLLKLKLNAQEDLLLNGHREPSHRGVCLHLLGKVELARVQAALPGLDPKAATAFLRGIVRFSPDINYVLLFLQCVQQSESRGETTAALAQALRRIEFAAVSAAQMARVVKLLVQVLPRQELPIALLSLMDSSSFRVALDRTAEQLPPELAEIAVPLRAAHSVILHNRQDAVAPADVARGAALLLGASPEALMELSTAAQRRLLEHGLDAVQTQADAVPAVLHKLVEGFQSDPRQHGDWLLRIARVQLRVGNEQAAKKTLNQLTKRYPDFRQPAQWLEALERPRVGRFAILDRRKGESPPLSGQEFKLQGVLCLETQRPAWLCQARPEHQETFTRFAAALERAVVPGVLRPLASGVTASGEQYLVLPPAGLGARRLRDDHADLSETNALDLCVQGLGMLAALAALGVRLPDAALSRFSATKEGRLWLGNLWGAELVSPADAALAHTLLGKRWVADVFGAARCSVSPARAQQVAAAESCASLVRVVDGW